MRPAFTVLLVVALCPLSVLAVGREDLLVQMQAADVLGEAIQTALERGPATRPAEPATRPAPTISYRELFDQAVEKIKKGQDVNLDASLNNLTTAQLFGEMTALQTYNFQQYARLSGRRDGGPTT